MPIAADSLERLVPDELRADDATGTESLALHLERYAFAAEQARPGRLLDIACGVGYGTQWLAEHVPSAHALVGVDVSGEAIAYARTRYADARIRYVESDVMSFEPGEPFDTIVSLETVEHLREPGPFLHRLVDWLRPGGTLVASVPTTPSVDVNPHHLHDFDERSFRSLVADLPLRELAGLRQVQPFSLGRIAGRSEKRLEDLRPGLLGWYLRHPGALVRRIGALVRHGAANHYLTLAWRRM